MNVLKLYKVCINNDNIKWPRECPCCFEKPDTEIPLSTHYLSSRYMEKEKSLEFVIPYCNECLEHIKSQKPSNHIITVGVILTILLLFMKLWIIAIICFITSIVISYFVSSSKGKTLKNYKDSCTSLDEAVMYFGYVYGRHIFNFQSESYANAFVKSNLHDKEITIEETGINSDYNNI